MTSSGPTGIIKLGILAVSAMMLVSLLVPTPAAEAQSYGSTPCPQYAIQDVFDDPNTDWDNDGVGNSDELYNGLNPCIVDTASFCGGGGNPLCYYPTYTYVAPSPCQNAVNTNPNGDFDGDGLTNATEVRNGADPCNRPCVYPTNADLALDPNGDWDGDGTSNAIEVNLGTNPCSATVRRYVNPCPYWDRYDVNAAPHHDWDGDGVSNIDEVRRGTSPCRVNTVQRLPHVTAPKVHKRLPHVTVAPPPPAATPRCPHGYPYYHPDTRLCYANPVGRRYY